MGSGLQLEHSGPQQHFPLDGGAGTGGVGAGGEGPGAGGDGAGGDGGEGPPLDVILQLEM